VKPVFVTTTFTIKVYAITPCRGLVRGSVVRSPTLVQGFLGGHRQIVGARYDGSEVQGGGGPPKSPGP